MKKQSAGLLIYKIDNGQIKVLIAHMGGPWWANKDKGAWSIPKGEHDGTEQAFEAARREFKEELGLEAPEGEPIELGQIEQKNNKLVTAWAVEANLDLTKTRSNTVEIEWPPHSGKLQSFPEIDRAEYHNLDEACVKLIPEQVELLQRLSQKLNMVWRPKATQPEKPLQNSLF